MKVSFYVSGDGEPLIWANGGQKATLWGILSVKGVWPFLFLPVFPHGWLIKLCIANLLLDMFLRRKRADGIKDFLRRYRTFLNAGYWRLMSRQQVRQRERVWDWCEGMHHD